MERMSPNAKAEFEQFFLQQAAPGIKVKLHADDFLYTPVDVRTFCEDPYYLGSTLHDGLYPPLDDLVELFEVLYDGYDLLPNHGSLSWCYPRTKMKWKVIVPAKPAERMISSGKVVRHRILLSISESEFQLVEPCLEYVNLPDHLNLHQPDHRLQYAYFPNSGMISLVVVTEDGRTVEVGVVGSEGFSGAPLLFGLKTSPIREVVQIAGNGFRIRAAAIEDCLASAPELRTAMGRYAVILGMQISQTAACNRLHTVEQRLARWLLVTRDRVDSEFLPITHDFLATMLGTDRPTVSLTANTLQKNHVLQYKRGAVKIVNRKKLEACACECYEVIQRFNPMLGLS
jgi:CRP-like cAMP-binding protein